MDKSGKQLSIQDWETLIEDFQSSTTRREKWLAQYPGLTILEPALYSVLRKDFSLKFQLIIFLEEYADLLITDSDAEEGLGSVLEALRAVIQSPVDGISITYALKEQMMVSSTSIMIIIDALKKSVQHLEGLTELLLTVINRPNHSLDRRTRSVACECLRELERAYPRLLAEIGGHLWNLCHSERTHASQSYILLLMTVIHELVRSKTNVSILTTSVPLVPFNVPHLVMNSNSNSEISNSNFKELRRAMAFLLERPQMILTPSGIMEFMWMLTDIATVLELQASLLKVQFSGLLYSYDPILCHVVVMLYSRFSDAFDGEESEIACRLMLRSKEVQQHLVFRLLTLHWLLGFIGLPSKRKLVKKDVVISMSFGFYPTVFDPLALKALKLDLLSYCAICLDVLKLESPRGGSGGGEENGRASVVKVFEDGLVCVSAFKWLPPWSMETMVVFRALHKFLIGAMPHSGYDDSAARVLMESIIFHISQSFLVNMALEFSRLVPIIVSFVDRLLGCSSHSWLGERLLQTFDKRLLSKLATDYQLASYFPIFDRIAENDTIPPHSLLELLTTFVIFLVEKHCPDTGLKSWSRGSKVLGICRTMLMHHHSSRVFLPLSRLLAFTCQYFPDLEIRDNARIYLRMLVCIPGKKLRHILNLGEQLPGISPSPHLSSLFQTQSPRPSQDFKKSRDLSLYIHLERVTPLLVKQSWSLAISTLGSESNKPSYFEGIGDANSPIDIESEAASCSDVQILSKTERISLPQEPLRVMDSKVAEILWILRRHFACIPDYRHMPGLRIKILCTLGFESEPFNRIWGVDSSATSLDGVDALPALYATVITFSSSSRMGLFHHFTFHFFLVSL
ncbi:uncharacterized protein LOC143864372 [Tasmannia lanceolata]|uniref:uncharacterized protein LOC143864372 n=1 Tax=Tasmannia lanceolata TaxID=3420 RepID=UPI0040647EBF